MVKDGRKSHGKLCLGVYRSARKCTLARNKKGEAAVMNRLCDVCGEQRCRAHCKCARTDAAKGRRAARGASSKSETTSPPAVVGTVGRAPAPSSALLEDVAHMMRLVDKELETAVEVEMATYQYDNLKLHTRLVARLKDRSAFSLNVLIDENQFGGRVPKLQRTRLAELQARGNAKCTFARASVGRARTIAKRWSSIADIFTQAG